MQKDRKILNIERIRGEILEWLMKESDSDLEEVFNFNKKKLIENNKKSNMQELVFAINAYESFFLDKEFYEIRKNRFLALLSILSDDFFMLMKQNKKLSMQKELTDENIVSYLKSLYINYPKETTLDSLIGEHEIFNINLKEELANYSIGEFIFNRDEIVENLSRKINKIFFNYPIISYINSVEFNLSKSFIEYETLVKISSKKVIEKALVYYLLDKKNIQEVNVDRTTETIKSFLNQNEQDWEKRANKFLEKELNLDRNIDYVKLLGVEVDEIFKSSANNIESYSNNEAIKILEIVSQIYNLKQRHIVDDQFGFFEKFHKKLYGEISEEEYFKIFDKFSYETNEDDIVSPNNVYYLGNYLIDRDLILKYQNKDNLEAYVIEKSYNLNINVPEIIYSKEFGDMGFLSLEIKNFNIKQSKSFINISIDTDFDIKLTTKEILLDLSGAISEMKEYRKHNKNLSTEIMGEEINKIFNKIVRKWKMQQDFSNDEVKHKKRKV